MSREALDAAWQDFFRERLSTGGAIAECQGLVDMERQMVDAEVDKRVAIMTRTIERLVEPRATVDRQVAVKAIRFAATWTSGGRAVLEDLANRLEREEIEIPEPRK